MHHVLSAPLRSLQAADSLFGAPQFGSTYPAGVIPLMRLVSAGFATAGFTSLALKVPLLQSHCINLLRLELDKLQNMILQLLTILLRGHK